MLTPAKLVKNLFLRTFAISMDQHDSTIRPTPENELPVWFLLDVRHQDTAQIVTVPDSATHPPGMSWKNPHFFKGNTVKILPDPPTVRPHHDQDWLYGSFAILLILIVLLRLTWPRHITRLFRSTLFPSKDNPEGRIFEFKFDSFSLVFMLIYGMTYSLLLVALLKDMQWIPKLQPQESVIMFFLFSLGFIALIGFKWTMAAISSAIFGVKKQGVFYRDHLLISGFVSAALILPFVVINVFSNSLVFLFIALTIMGISESVRLIRSFAAATGIGSFSYVHIIMYFCTLETVPLMIVGKILLILQMM